MIRLTNEKIKILSEIKKHIESGLSLTKVCKLYKKSITRTAHELKKELNFVSPNKNNKKHNYNETFFEKIDTEEKAYWLGFLYADGSVIKKEVKGNTKNAKNKTRYVLELCLAKKDEEHLLSFSKMMCSPVSQKKVKGKEKTFEAVRTTITSKKIVEDLIKLGCVPNKSLILKFPTKEQVPEELIRHFMRGYFDGDGCIHYTEKNKGSFSIMGTLEFLGEYEKRLLLITGLRETKKRKKGRAYSLFKGGKQNLIKIKKFLYLDSIIFLKRKKEKFDILPS